MADFKVNISDFNQREINDTYAWRKENLGSKIMKFFRRFFKGRISRGKFFKLAALVFFVAVVGSLVLGVILFAWSARNLPSPDKVVRREGFATKILDRNDKLLYDVYSEQRRIPIDIKDAPANLKNATVAIEDKNFYKHKGFDPFGFLRIFYNVAVRRQLTGGSTLTQQLVKNVLLTSERTVTRKAKEFILSVQIENKYSKDQILQMYLNETPYGGTAWGVEAAAETYFGKKASQLSLTESAILAGLPQRPSYYSPYGAYPKAYIARAEDVLRRMREDGYISPAEEKKSTAELANFKFRDSEGQFEAPHFVMYVKGILEEKYGEKIVEQGGLRVTTTLDLELQKKAQEAVTQEIKKVEDLHITNGASIVLDPQTGEILAMVGSKNYNDPDYDGKVNVTLSLRQPGSSIKPVTYATAFAKGWTPAKMLVDTKTEFPGGANNKPYIPANYDGKDHGPVSLRQSLGSSLNINSVKLLAQIGVKDMLTTAYKMGLKTLEPTQANVNRFGLSVTLGGGEVRLLDLAGAYSAFANSGFKVEPIAILKVEDRDGKVLQQVKPQKGERVLSAGVAYLINNVLSDNKARLLTFGENSLLNIAGTTVAVKTGTTDDKRDNWTIGWTPKFLVGVWVGNNDNSQMKQVASGVTGASPIWRQTVMYLLSRYPGTEFGMPEGINKLSVDVVSGWPAHEGYAAREEVMISGTEPTGRDPIHTKVKVCKDQKDKLATETMIARGDYEEKEAIVLKEDDPLSSDGKNRWQEGINAWLGKQSDEKYKISSEYCNQNQEVVVRFRKPQDKQQIDSNEVEIEIEAISNGNINKVELWLDGDKKESFSAKPYKTKLVISDGVHILKATAQDDKGTSSENEIKIGINQAVDSSPLPSSSPQASSSPTASSSPSPPPN